MPPLTSVSNRVELRLVVPGGPTLPVVSDLRYRANDPWAVAVTFHTGGPDESVVEWLFARQLLTDGVTGPVGEGDVRISPAGEDGRIVRLAMTSPSGSAAFEVERDVLVDFLQLTYRVVPSGAEGDMVDLEAGLSALLDAR